MTPRRRGLRFASRPLLLKIQKDRVGAAQMLLDGAQPHAELLGELPLRHPVDAMPAEDRRRTGRSR